MDAQAHESKIRPRTRHPGTPEQAPGGGMAGGEALEASRVAGARGARRIPHRRQGVGVEIDAHVSGRLLQGGIGLPVHESGSIEGSPAAVVWIPSSKGTNILVSVSPAFLGGRGVLGARNDHVVKRSGPRATDATAAKGFNSSVLIQIGCYPSKRGGAPRRGGFSRLSERQKTSVQHDRRLGFGRLGATSYPFTVPHRLFADAR
jgi:hypothetical protein